VLDLNLPAGEAPDAILTRELAAMRPDIVGFSKSYAVSYPWLRALTEAVKWHDAAPLCSMLPRPVPAPPARGASLTEPENPGSLKVALPMPGLARALRSEPRQPLASQKKVRITHSLAPSA
jgi:hypothetical protein